MVTALNWFRLDPSWSSLFERLPGWVCPIPGTWTDGWTTVELSVLNEEKPLFGFTQYGTREGRVGRSEPGPRAEESAKVITSPGGIPVLLKHTEGVGRRPGTVSLRMNHVSVNVTDLGQERRWYESLLGRGAILARDEAWDPVSRKWAGDAHLFSKPWYYLTIRECGSGANVDHVGWMADCDETVHLMADVVNDLGWKIVYGPAEIDGSFLFHFDGPDGKIHDFFHPLDELQRRTRLKG